MRSYLPRGLARTGCKRAAAISLTLATTAAIATTAVTFADAAATQHTPTGKMDSIAQDGRLVALRGWAYDPDTRAAVTVRISVDGKHAKSVLADLDRPDVAQSHPGVGSDHGFLVSWQLTGGTHRVCTYAVDPSSGVAAGFGCHKVTVSHNPTGTITRITQFPGKVRVSGWAVDNDAAPRPRTVAVRIDGTELARGPADRNAPNFALAHPASGPTHGFAYTVPITEGTHKICVKVANFGPGVNSYLPCVTKVINFSPTGKITALTQAPGGLTISGYASDPDTTDTTVIAVKADGRTIGTAPASDPTGNKPGYGFHGTFLIGGANLAPGARNICVVARNLGDFGTSRFVQCIIHTFNWNPRTAITSLAQSNTGVTVTGWAFDPDTSSAVSVTVTADGTPTAPIRASGAGGTHPGHMFTKNIALGDGSHTICLSAANLSYGSGPTASRCKTINLSFRPFGAFESVTRAGGSSDVVATGWAIDPNTTGAISVQVSLDGAAPVTGRANINRPDLAKSHPGAGTAHGYAVRVPTGDGEHQVCVRAVDVPTSTGTTVALGCKTIIAVHPTVPAAPTAVTAVAGFGGAQITWTPPASDGGAPWTSYTVTANPGGLHKTVGAGIQAATVLGLKPGTDYTFAVVANNVAGPSPAGVSPVVTTQNAPPPQTSPAPISTSRYIRNVFGSSATDLARMRSEGAADAAANPSGHGFLTVLAVGGQDESREGLVLSATIRFVTYSSMVKDLEAYVDGYATKQRPSAPVTIAIATNNDIDVSRSSGANFANKVIDPVAGYAKKYPGITIAGSDDMEPGFLAGYAATNAWLGGYLSATRAPFVFTGSADGCGWTAPGGRCNNGWTMSGLYHLAAGANPIQMVNLPQVYNTTMAQQWRYISLTGVQGGQPKINFGGALTEWTACHQARSCGSLTGNSAWTAMWNQLRAEPRLRPNSLPYSTDLRIDS
jgi:hypothetical protein